METVCEVVQHVTGMTLDFNSACDVFYEWIRGVSHSPNPDSGLREWLLASASDEPTLPILSLEVTRFLDKVHRMMRESGTTALSPQHFEFSDPQGNTWRRCPTIGRTRYGGGHPQYQYRIDRNKRQLKSRWNKWP